MSDTGELKVIQAGVATFFGRPQANPAELDGVDVALSGVPWDEGNAGRNGANMGPRAFRDTSSWFFGYDAQRGRDVWESLTVVDAGDDNEAGGGCPESRRATRQYRPSVRSARDPAYPDHS